MAISEQPREKSRDELLAEIWRAHHPRSFEEMLGPEPQPGDADDLEDFLRFLHSHRHPVRTPDDQERP
jgi:hypothetical protein